MSASKCAEVVVYVCCNCLPHASHLPRQWKQDGIEVRVQEVPCSGKIDAQYLFHAIEGGAQGVCVVACPQGDCRLAQGNYRAEIRVQSVQRLLTEIGMEPERIAIVHSSPDEGVDPLQARTRQVVEQFAALAQNPVGAEVQRAAS
jgi:F420-non-reducing hydrogenase iron-sulfur subunit